jgi:murein L,D-transpeptidase YafK
MGRVWSLRGLGYAAVLLASLAAILTLAPAAAHAVTIEIDDVAPDRVERQRAFAAGTLPLPGTPDLARLDERLEAKGLKTGAQLFIRVFKSESELEVWMRKGEAFELLATYPICHWAGTIGPKLREGDKQNPEGFYSVGARQLHRIGRWPRSLNLGYPNSYDRAWGRTGSYILVHGGCSSIGCFAMTNAVMAEIFALSEQALRAGQPRIELHVFPFRMTEANLALHVNNPWIDFWRNLKEGYDAFEETRLPPRVGLCDRRYVVETVRPGEVGAESPLASCGALRAAIVEPSSRSFAALLPPDWPQSLPLRTAAATSAEPEASAIQRSHLSGLPLPPPPTLAEQSRLLPPPVVFRQPAIARLERSPRIASRALSPVPPQTGGQAAVPLPRPVASMPPPCNSGLASCRKFLALRARNEQARLAAAQRANRARANTRIAQAVTRPAASATSPRREP